MSLYQYAESTMATMLASSSWQLPSVSVIHNICYQFIPFSQSGDAYIRHRSPVNSPHKGQWTRALMFSLIWAWINGWVNNREAGDLRRHYAWRHCNEFNPLTFEIWYFSFISNCTWKPQLCLWTMSHVWPLLWTQPCVNDRSIWVYS